MATRLPLLDPDQTTGKVRSLLDGVRAKRGIVPGLMRVLASSPAALGAFLGFGRALAEGVLPEALRERIAIASASAQGCEACLVIHEDLGRKAGLDDGEIAAARAGRSADAASAIALAFGASVLARQGRVGDADLAAMRAAGFDDAAVLEVVATVYLNAFTNAVNNLAGTPPEKLADRQPT